eukprot:8318506-Alexandrium_andersonii.AAC.1
MQPDPAKARGSLRAFVRGERGEEEEERGERNHWRTRGKFEAKGRDGGNTSVISKDGWAFAEKV